MDPREAKRLTRDRIARVIAGMDVQRRRDHDARVIEQAMDLLAARRPRLVMAYVPLPDEIAIGPLLERICRDSVDGGPELLLPRVVPDCREMCLHVVADLKRRTRPGVFGILEPQPECSEKTPGAGDVVLVPGRAFSANGDRLGRGGGYYDRFLGTTEAFRLALAYDEQVLPEVPTGPSDLPVHAVLTPTRYLVADGRAGTGPRA